MHTELSNFNTLIEQSDRDSLMEQLKILCEKKESKVGSYYYYYYYYYLSNLSKGQGVTKRQSLYKGASLKIQK